MITGQEKPDSGSFKVGETVKMAYVDQSRDQLDGSKSVFDEISGGSETMLVGNKEQSSRAYVSRFNFNGADQQKRVGDLSGAAPTRLVYLLHLLRRIDRRQDVDQAEARPL